MQPEQQQRIMGYFIEEAKDHLNTIEQGLLNLQATIEDPEMVNELFRAAHSVKGGAAMLGINSVQQVSHRLEDFFKILKESRVQVDQKLESLLLRVFDALQELLEQLQGPFGLTDEMANSTLAGVQPAFDELQHHLDILVGEVEPVVTSMPTTGFLSGDDLVPVPFLDADLAQTFGTEVPIRLREMLQLFKQADADGGSRERLEAICRELTSMGQSFDLSAWCRLVDMARQAIAQPHNSYRILAPVVIRDIKQAQDLVLAGRADEITPCAQLLEMVPAPSSVEVAADTDFADLLAVADNADLEFDLTGSSELFDEASPFQSLDLEQGTDLASSSSDLDFGDVFGEASLAMDVPGQQGPEVGMAELNSLADLFEGEVPDLGSTWQEEEIIGDASGALMADSGNLASDRDETDEPVDFSDLLFDESDMAPTIIQSQSDDLSDLFGDDLLEEEESTAESEAVDLPSLNSSEADELEDWLTMSESDDVSGAEDRGAIATPADEQDPFAGLDLETELGLGGGGDSEFGPESSGEPDTELGDLGELFAGMDESDLNFSSLEAESEALFSSVGTGEDENLFGGATDEPGESHPVENAIVTDPWEEFSGEEFSGSSSSAASGEPDTPVLTDPGEGAFADVFGDAAAVGDNLLETGTTDELIETLSDQGEADFSSLFETTETFPETTEDSAIEELIDDSPDFTGDSWLLDSPESVGPEPEDLSDRLSPEASALESSDGGLELDLSELDLGESLDPGESEITTPAAADTMNLDFGEFDLPVETPESPLAAEPSAPESTPSELTDLWAELPETTDLDLGFDESVSGIETPITESLISQDTDPFAEDLAAIVGVDATETYANEPPVEANFDADLLELENLGMASESTTPDSGLAEDLPSEGAIEFGDLDFSAETPTEPLDLGDLGDDLGDLLGEPGIPTLSEAGELNNFLGEAIAPETPEDFGDLGDLLGESSAAGEPIDFGDLGDLPGEADILTAEESANLGDLLGEPTSTEPTDFGGLDNLSGEADGSMPGEAADLDSLLGEPAAPAEPIDFGDLGAGDLPGEAVVSTAGEAEDLNGLLGEPASAEPADFNDLGDLLGEAAVATVEAATDLDDLLGESSPAESVDFGDLGDLLGEATAPISTGADDLGDLLGEGTASETSEDFGDLGDLLGAPSFSSDTPDSDAPDSDALDFGDLGDLLGEATASEPERFEHSDLSGEFPTSGAVNEFEELDSLLGEENSVAPVGDFTDLDNLIGETAPDVAHFADLDNLLNEDSPAPASGSSLEGSSRSPDIGSQSLTEMEDFADLEALLEADEPASSSDQLIEPSTDSDFDELDDLLKDAEERMGGSPSVPVSRGLGAQNRRLPRPGRVFSEQTMRVPVKHLDNLSNLVGELVVNRNSLEQDQERLRQSLDNLLYQVQQLSDVGQRMQDLYERSLLESSLLASRQSYRQGSGSPLRDSGESSIQTASTSVEYDPLEMDRFTGFHSLSQEMIELIVRVRESASDIEFIVDETDQVTRMFRQVTTQLQEGLTRSRMVPFAQTADRLPRAVRDISMRVGKQAELVIEGRETLIDKMILEQLYDPMTHLVNNALTHGIEPPDVRRAAGKPAAGRITVRAFHQGNQTIISVSDDGAGIDVERVKAKAIEKGLITPAEARSMSRLDVYDLLFHAGFSTKDQADDFSGRGVGMDVVRTSLSEIRGVINTDSTPGKGTTFTIRLPLTLSISKALCCISDRARIAFPMDGVEDMLDVPKERIQTNAEGQPCLPWRDSLLPLRPLVDLLAYNRHLSRGNVYGGNQEDDIASIVVLRSAGNFLALQVDQVLGEQEIVIKQLEGPVPKPVGVAGATVLGDGRIMPIADVLELIDLAMGRIRKDAGGSLWDQGSATIAQEPQVTKTEPMVLIVDDSITVRELLSMTFNKVGYRVEQARDGQEAWEKLRSGLPCDIVFCDIEMPRMDGLELLSRIQKDPNLTHLPIAMLTSRGADRHRQMASSLGASGYFTKPYLEEALLDAAQRMLKGERLL